MALCFALAWVPQSKAALSRIGSGTKDCNSTATTCSVTYSPTSGNLVRIWVVASYGSPPTINSVTDNATGGSTSYSSAFNVTSTMQTAAKEAEFYTCSVKSGVSTITANFSHASYAMVIVEEWSGQKTSGCLDKVSASASGTSSAAASNYSGTLSQANEVAVGDLWTMTGEYTFTGTNGFTNSVNVAETHYGWEQGTASRVVSATTSLQATASLSTSGSWEAFIVTYEAAGNSYTATPSESNNASDTISRLATLGRADSETNVASDAIARRVSFGRGDSESNAASDAISRLAGFGRGNSESNPASDAIARSAVYGRGGSETNSAADSLARLASFGRGDSETNVASDLIARSGVFGRGDTETSTVADSIARSAVYGRGDSETNNTADSLARLAGFGRGDSESNPASDAVASLETVPGTYSAALYETSTISDTVAIAQALNRRDSESNTASDAIARLASFARADSESWIVHGVGLSWTPSSTPVVPGTTDIAYNVYEGPSADNITNLLTSSPVDEDCTSTATCTYTDSTCNVPYETCYYDVTAVIIEGGAASAPSNIVSALIPDGASDNLASNQALGRGASETNTASDAIARSQGLSRGDAETLSVSDSLVRRAVSIRGDSENDATSDLLTREASFGRGNNEALSASDNLKRVLAASRSDTEALSTSDSLSRIFAALRGDMETLAFSDAIVGLRNYSLTVLPGHEFAVPGHAKSGAAPGQAKSGAVPGQAKTGEEPDRVKSGTAPVH
jgi:hypothetical protein